MLLKIGKCNIQALASNITGDELLRTEETENMP
jgi:hypothetical protein